MVSGFITAAWNVVGLNGRMLQIQESWWQKEKLCNILLDGRLELTNNRAEQTVKPFVIGRKNWLFTNTPAGAKASATVYIIIETA